MQRESIRCKLGGKCRFRMELKISRNMIRALFFHCQHTALSVNYVTSIASVRSMKFAHMMNRHKYLFGILRDKSVKKSAKEWMKSCDMLLCLLSNSEISCEIVTEGESHEMTITTCVLVGFSHACCFVCNLPSISTFIYFFPFFWNGIFK